MNSKLEMSLMATAGWVSGLHEHGYCVIPDLVPRTSIDKLNADMDSHFGLTPFCVGDFYGPNTKRFGSLLKRSSVAAAFIHNQMIIAIAQTILGPWCDRVNLNLAQGIEIHPGAPAQYPHRDQDMWQGPKGGMEYLLNVIWPLTDFTEENGGTLIWPESHGAGALDTAPSREPVVARMEPGEALLFLGSTLHGAGANRTASVRRAMIVSYCLGWLKPFENQWLCYPPDVARHFDPDLAGLVGYSLHRPNLGNYEGQDPVVLLADQAPGHLAATDALRPDQQTALEEFMALRRQGERPQHSPPRDSGGG